MTRVSHKNGNFSYYIPGHTYSCENGLWVKHCIESSILSRMFGALIILVSIVQMFNILLPNFVESFINGGILGTTWMLFFELFFEWELTHFEVILSSVFVGLLVAVVFGVMSCYVRRIGCFSSRFIVSYIVFVYVLEYAEREYVSLILQILVAFVVSVGLMWLNFTFSVISGAIFLVHGLSNILRGNLHRVLLNNFESMAAPPKSLFNPIVKENYINYSLPLNPIDIILIVFYLVIVIVVTMRKEFYYKENPEIFECRPNFFSNSLQTSSDYNKTNARRRSQRRYGALQNGRDHLRKLSFRGRRHYYYRTASGGRNPLISHWARDESEGSDNVFESPESNSRFMSRLEIPNWRNQ